MKDLEVQEIFLKNFPELKDNESQCNAVFNSDGPTLIIAGPGTGKTFTLVLRTLFLMLTERAKPSEIIVSTFTEKASFELRDRISQFSKKLGIRLNLHELKMGTLHSICEDFITHYFKKTPLNKNFTVLDDLTSKLFINENFKQIVEAYKIDGRFFGKWIGKWKTISYLVEYFNKITEELIDINKLIKNKDEFLKSLGQSYSTYRELLFESNKVDFAFLQKILYDLLLDNEVNKKITSQIKYVLIDEYQDTNYIQEQIALKLSKCHNNICVVGDEDQSLYRFRGATVRNILEFPNKFANCNIIKLLSNYRSHEKIIEHCNTFIESINWHSDDNEKYFRFPNKSVKVAETTFSPDYPAVFSIWVDSEKEEANRFADLVEFLLKNKIIQDPSDVALLLRSVRIDYSGPFIEALAKKNIKAFCPRARAYFENNEVKIAIACYALIFGFVNEDLNGYEHRSLIEEGLQLLSPYIGTPLASFVKFASKEFLELTNKQTLDKNVADYLYQLFAYKPFSDFLKDENKARNLSILSSLLNTFILYYHFPVISSKNKLAIKYNFFNSFLNLLISSGQNEFEDEDNPIPRGYVQIMTIHQSKGLEFPVVVVGSLDKQFSVGKEVDRVLSHFYHRGEFEPLNRVTTFDHARTFYVAFSRAQKLLVLSTSSTPKPIFNCVWEGLDQWPHVKKQTLLAQKFRSKAPYVPKKSFSLTSHINIYETCPRQYKFYKELEFTPSRTGQIIFGTLVHETIEDLHRSIIENERVDETKIIDDFEKNYKALVASGLRPLALHQRESAKNQVLTYFHNNKDLLKRVIDTEVDVSVEKDDYIITGKVDLLLGRDNKLEVLDFKSQSRPEMNDSILERYKKQLNLYAYILKERYNKEPERLYIYWTAEEKRKDALMEIEYDPKLVEEAGKHFDSVAKSILNRSYEINNWPDKTKVCKECDFKFYCRVEQL
ncbi:MAG: ATP-dependent helicase [Ignavibacterium album]|uniref:ATP-dependent helicase n=1 Tax=Ignavibacterium album TaxID=591197 RepID=UPI0026ED7D5E|nr:ATP-dependent DNA helicase [Ignavibacterium album]MCX8106738.1 ATP-dependent helicase [Ignavibacterium album]